MALSTIALIAIISAVVVVATGVVLIVLWQTGILWKKSDSDADATVTTTPKRSTVSFTSSVMTESRMFRQTVKPVSGCDVVAASDTLSCGASFVDGMRACIHDAPDITYDGGKDYRHMTSCPLANGKGGVSYYVPASAFDLSVPLDNITGTYVAISLHLADDMFANGFNPGGKENEATDPMVQVEDTLSKLDQGIALVGTVAPFISDTATLTRYTFDVTGNTGSKPDIRTLTDAERAKLTTVTGDHLFGVLRYSVETVQYWYQLDGKKMAFQVCLAGPNFRMADKMILDSDGHFKFLVCPEGTAPNTWTLSTSRPSDQRVLSFWNGHTVQSEYFQEELNQDMSQDTAKAAAFAKLMNDSRFVGMPLKVTNESVDFATAINADIVIDLAVNTYAFFDTAKQRGLSEADLANNRILQVILYSMEDLNFTASIR